MKETITFSISKQLRRKIDALRGDNTKFITRLIESTMSEGKSKNGSFLLTLVPETDVFNPTESLFLDQDKKEKDHVSSDKTENAAAISGEDVIQTLLIGLGGLILMQKRGKIYNPLLLLMSLYTVSEVKNNKQNWRWT
jgi:hypothetical protein